MGDRRYLPATETELLLEEEVNRLKALVDCYDDAIADICTSAQQDLMRDTVDEWIREDKEEYGDLLL